MGTILLPQDPYFSPNKLLYSPLSRFYDSPTKSISPYRQSIRSNLQDSYNKLPPSASSTPIRRRHSVTSLSPSSSSPPAKKQSTSELTIKFSIQPNGWQHQGQKSRDLKYAIEDHWMMKCRDVLEVPYTTMKGFQEGLEKLGFDAEARKAVEKVTNLMQTRYGDDIQEILCHESVGRLAKLLLAGEVLYYSKHASESIQVFYDPSDEDNSPPSTPSPIRTKHPPLPRLFTRSQFTRTDTSSSALPPNSNAGLPESQDAETDDGENRAMKSSHLEEHLEDSQEAEATDKDEQAEGDDAVEAAEEGDIAQDEESGDEGGDDAVEDIEDDGDNADEESEADGISPYPKWLCELHDLADQRAITIYFTNDDVNSQLPSIIPAFQEWDDVILDEIVNLYHGSSINPDVASLRELLTSFLRHGANRSHADYPSWLSTRPAVYYSNAFRYAYLYPVIRKGYYSYREIQTAQDLPEPSVLIIKSQPKTRVLVGNTPHCTSARIMQRDKAVLKKFKKLNNRGGSVRHAIPNTSISTKDADFILAPLSTGHCEGLGQSYPERFITEDSPLRRITTVAACSDRGADYLVSKMHHYIIVGFGVGKIGRGCVQAEFGTAGIVRGDVNYVFD